MYRKYLGRTIPWRMIARSHDTLVARYLDHTIPWLHYPIRMEWPPSESTSVWRSRSLFFFVRVLLIVERTWQDGFRVRNEKGRVPRTYVLFLSESQQLLSYHDASAVAFGLLRPTRERHNVARLLVGERRVGWVGRRHSGFDLLPLSTPKNQ